MPAILANQSTYDTFFAQQQLSNAIQDGFFPITKRGAAQQVGGNPWLQRASSSPYVEHGETEGIWNRRNSLTNEEMAQLQTPVGIVDLNQEGIELALDRRVALFFQQSILCYKMPFVFSARGADDQIGTASAIQFSNQEQTGRIVHRREAAHSSTLPTLFARAKNDPTGATFVYLKGGSSHAQHNATIGMHVHVNGADELLDGKGEGGLRSAAIKILNQVADGLDPIQATKEFLRKFEEHAKRASQRLNPQDVRKAVLDAYVEGIQIIARQAESDPLLFDRLIGVNINLNDPKERIIRETIYQRRYDIIRLEEAIESRIGKRIVEAKKNMNPRDGSFLEYMLLKEFAQTPQRKTLEKLFGKTAVIFEEEYTNSLSPKEKTTFKTFQTRVQNLQGKYPQPLDDLKRDLRGDFRKLSSSEFAYRSQVFKDLRTRVRNWTQKSFCQIYHETTGKKVSQAWVSRMEQPSRIDTKIVYATALNQRTRPITLEDAQSCAQTFGIDVGLFLPCLITSGSN